MVSSELSRAPLQNNAHSAVFRSVYLKYMGPAAGFSPAVRSSVLPLVLLASGQPAKSRQPAVYTDLKIALSYYYSGFNFQQKVNRVFSAIALCRFYTTSSGPATAIAWAASASLAGWVGVGRTPSTK